MFINLPNRHRATIAGILIIMAYSMLVYTITNNKILGAITDIISGFAVIGIPVLMFPIFNVDRNKTLNYGYVISRFIEGLLMIIGGIIILIPSLNSYREVIYSNIHVYFFISGALFFYILFYRTQVIPRFIAIWGILATIILLAITLIKLFKVDSTTLDALILPMILNELFLAFWLIIKGFNLRAID